MNKKNILFLVSKNKIDAPKKLIHYGWVNECKNIFNINFFGPHYNEKPDLESLKIAIDNFKPDYIYCYDSMRLRSWLPDISGLKDIPKIFVELDTYKHKSNDEWYKQFDRVLCRENAWDKNKSKILTEADVYDYLCFVNEKLKLKIIEKKLHKRSRSFLRVCKERLKNASTWSKFNVFRWSVDSLDICRDTKNKRSGINFIGRAFDMLYPLYPSRYQIYKRFYKKINFITEWDRDKYLNIMRTSSALLCPTETAYGDFIPAKLVEMAASGAALITNCNLKKGFPDLDSVAIKYTDLDDLRYKIKHCHFYQYYNKTSEIMHSHTHEKRYKEIFV